MIARQDIVCPALMKGSEMKPVILWIVRGSGKVIGVYQTHKTALLKMSERGDEPELQKFTIPCVSGETVALEDVCRFINNFCLEKT